MSATDIEKFCLNCCTEVYYDTTEHYYACECYAVEPTPSEDEVSTWGLYDGVPRFWKSIEDSEIGIEAIAFERQRQIEKEGWTEEHDDRHTEEQLIDAAMCYLAPYDEVIHGMRWPWEEKWWKPKDNRIRQLKIAGALIAAEIDRLVRMAEVDTSTLAGELSQWPASGAAKREPGR